MTVKVPPEWAIETGQRTYLTVTSSYENPQDNFREIFTITLLPVRIQSDAKSILDVNVERLRQRFRAQLLEGSVAIKGAHDWQVATLKYAPNEQVQLHTIMAVTLANQEAVLFIGTATEAQFGQVRPVFSDSLQSLQIK